MLLGDNLRKIRKNRKLTQTQLGEKVGINTSSISSIEKGLKIPKLETFINIALALNATPMELISNENGKDNISIYDKVNSLTDSELHFVEEQVKYAATGLKNIDEEMVSLKQGINNLGKKINRIRSKSNLSVSKLCETLGLTESYFYRIENGTNIPRLETLIKISESLGTSPLELLLDSFNLYKDILLDIFNLVELNGLNDAEYKFIYIFTENLLEQVNEFYMEPKKSM